MDDLRKFLGSRVKKRNHSTWQHLSKVLAANAAIKDVSGGPTTEHAIQTLHRLSLESKPPHALLPIVSLESADSAIEVLKQINHIYHALKRDLLKVLLDVKVDMVPLQLLCKLQCVGLLQISTYISRKLPSGNEEILSGAVLWLLTHPEDSSENQQIVMNVFTSLLVASQSGPLNLELSTICAAHLKKCVENIVSKLLNDDDDIQQPENSIDFSYLSSSELWSACGPNIMQNFLLTHLLCALTFTQHQLLYAVEIQEKMTLDNLAESFRTFLASIVKELGVEIITHQIGSAVVKPAVNWKAIFLLTATLLKIYPNSYKDLRRLTDELIQHGLEGGRQLELSAGFLLARHCCTLDSKNFSTYTSWFSSHFGSDSVTARNTVQFQSLLQLLTDIVPSESAEYLRIHINKVPQAPTSCNSILRDYTALARTRLADLNESSELAGLFRHDPIPGLDCRQADIVKVLQHFQQTREVLKAVLEASIFRRSYYRNVFLVELLGLSGSSEQSFNPQDFDLGSETRHEFIMVLQSMGKIPDKFYNAYIEKRSVGRELHRVDSVKEENPVENTKGESTDVFRKKRSLQLKR